MFTMETTKETVAFEYNGKSYCMTRDELEAAYRFKELEYREEDAKRAIEFYVFGDDDMDSDARREEQKFFEENEGIKYDDLLAGARDIVGIFFQKQDCNEGENTTWANAIEDYIQRLRYANA